MTEFREDAVWKAEIDWKLELLRQTKAMHAWEMFWKEIKIATPVNTQIIRK